MDRGLSRNIPAYFLYGEAPRRMAEPWLHVETIEARSAGHHWKIEPHVHHGLHQLVFVSSGWGVTLADGARAQYRSPAVMLIPAGTVHGFEFEPGTRGHVMSVSAPLLQELVRRDPATAELFSRPLTLELPRGHFRDTDPGRSMRALAREFARAEAGQRLALNGWLQVVVGDVMRLAQDATNPAALAGAQKRSLVARFMELIEQRYTGNHSVVSYAAALNVSSSRLRGLCLALTGQSPIQLIHARLLLEAKRQLHYTDRGIREIAHALGFDDAAYFTRFFSRRAGISPRAFRQRGPELISPGRPAGK
jgi:AraC family transcriptional activator of pobA